MSYFIQKLEQLQRVDGLINRKSTGSIKDFANKLGVSCRTINNLINELQLLGAVIEFDRQKISYIYLKRVKIFVTIIDDTSRLEELYGSGISIVQNNWDSTTTTTSPTNEHNKNNYATTSSISFTRSKLQVKPIAQGVNVHFNSSRNAAVRIRVSKKNLSTQGNQRNGGQCHGH